MSSFREKLLSTAAGAGITTLVAFTGGSFPANAEERPPASSKEMPTTSAKIKAVILKIEIMVVQKRQPKMIYPDMYAELRRLEGGNVELAIAPSPAPAGVSPPNANIGDIKIPAEACSQFKDPNSAVHMDTTKGAGKTLTFPSVDPYDTIFEENPELKKTLYAFENAPPVVQLNRLKDEEVDLADQITDKQTSKPFSLLRAQYTEFAILQRKEGL